MVATLATQLTLFILENLPTLIAAAAQILISIATGIAENLPTLIPAVVQAVLTIANTLIENVGQLIPVALQIIIALIQGITAALPQLIGYLPTIVTDHHRDANQQPAPAAAGGLADHPRARAGAYYRAA